MKKTVIDPKRAERVLDAVRRCVTVHFFDKATVRALGVPFDGALHESDPRVLPLFLEAGRAPGFGSMPADIRIEMRLDGNYGRGLWQKDRDPYMWERGGGDAELEGLHSVRDVVVLERAQLEEQMWIAHDLKQASRQFGTQGYSREERLAAERKQRKAAAAYDAALKAWEEARQRERRANVAIADRARVLNEAWQLEQVAAR